MLDAVVIVGSTKIHDFKNRNNCSKFILVAIVETALERNGNEITLVLALTKLEMFDRFWLSTFVIAATIGIITKVVCNLFGEITRVINNRSLSIMDRESTAAKTR